MSKLVFIVGLILNMVNAQGKPSMVWHTAMRINPRDGHTFGWSNKLWTDANGYIGVDGGDYKNASAWLRTTKQIKIKVQAKNGDVAWKVWTLSPAFQNKTIQQIFNGPKNTNITTQTHTSQQKPTGDLFKYCPIINLDGPIVINREQQDNGERISLPTGQEKHLNGDTYAGLGKAYNRGNKDDEVDASFNDKNKFQGTDQTKESNLGGEKDFGFPAFVYTISVLEEIAPPKPVIKKPVSKIENIRALSGANIGLIIVTILILLLVCGMYYKISKKLDEIKDAASGVQGEATGRQEAYKMPAEQELAEKPKDEENRERSREDN